MDEPHEIASYLERNAVRPAGGSIHRWGHGSATLPVPDIPTNVTLTERPDLENGIVVKYRKITVWEGPELQYLVRIWRRPEGEGPPQIVREVFIDFAFDSAHHIVDPGFTYFATVRACGPNATTDAACGPAETSNDLNLLTPLEVPTGFTATPRITSVRLAWDADRNADGYTAERIGAETQDVTDTIAVFRDLTPGETYTFRVRAYRGSETTAWTSTVSVTLPAPPEAPTITGNSLSTGRVQVTWTEPSGADTYKVRQCDRQAGRWRAHPYTEAGQTNPFSPSTTSGTTATISRPDRRHNLYVPRGRREHGRHHLVRTDRHHRRHRSAGNAPAEPRRTDMPIRRRAALDADPNPIGH